MPTPAATSALDSIYRGEHVQAVSKYLPSGDHPDRWRLTLWDPDNVGDEFTATMKDAPLTLSPSVVAGVASYKRRPRDWEITIEELYPPSAA